MSSGSAAARPLTGRAGNRLRPAEVWNRYQAQRRAGLGEFAATLTTKHAALRCDVDTMTDTLWMLQPAAYLRLVRDAGWSPERYEDWLADLLTRLFLV